MGDGHHGARVLVQEALQPRHGLGVEVVGGLVQQQHVGGRQQQAAQRHAALLATGQVGDLRIARRQAQGVHGHLHLPVEVPGVRALDGVLHALVLLEQGLHLVRLHRLAELPAHLVEPVEQLAPVGHALLHVAADVLGLIQLRLLWQVAHLHALAGHGVAVAGGDLAGHDLQQRALARAVQAQHADLRARQEGEGDVVEHHLVRRVRHPDLVHLIDKFILGHARDPRGAVRVTGGGQPEPGMAICDSRK